MSYNPYAPPGAALAEPSGDNTDEALRRAHVRHERQLKSVGALYYLGAFMMSLSAIVILATPGPSTPTGASPLPALFVLGIAVALGTIGFGFRRLRSWVRIPGGLLSGLGLLAIPVGTLIHGWILYLMFCAKGRMVLSPDYQRVIAATPHVRYQRTVGDWIALAVVLVLLLGIVLLIVIATA
ncbi:MAG TPA: hypothetical protein PKZ76_01530 [Xanthomonadaceae bacterium]|nr:hypothetical protein [Xanthomonadaceae bacterium]